MNFSIFRMRLICLLFFHLILFLPMLAKADYFVDFIWVREEAELGRVVVSLEQIRGREPVDDFKEHYKDHEKEGRYLMHRRHAATFRREFNVSHRSVEVELAMFPAPGVGLGGALPKATLRLYLDGQLRVCTDMTDSVLGLKSVESVVVHCADNTINLKWTSSDGPNESDVWFFPKKGNEVLTWDLNTEGPTIETIERPQPEPITPTPRTSTPKKKGKKRK